MVAPRFNTLSRRPQFSLQQKKERRSTLIKINAMASSPYKSLDPGALFFRPAQLDDLNTVHRIETESYPEDEAATREKLEFRIRNAPEAFLVASSSGGGGNGGGDEIVGYVCGTRSSEASLTHASMERHDPGGALLCVHSVCVAAPHRRKGVATRMLKAYLSYVSGGCGGGGGGGRSGEEGEGQEEATVSEVRLICKEEMKGLYAGAGFELVGPSPVVHGADPWFEMRYEVPR